MPTSAVIRQHASREAKHVGFPYQLEAVEAAKDLEYAAIFHEQGLGKTKIAIDLALTWLKSNAVDAVVFVTKKSLVANWREEIRTHSYLTPRVLSQDRKGNFFAFNSPAPFYLAHYEACVSEQKRLALFQKTRRVAIICDEAHKFKNPEGRIAKALHSLSAGFVRRVILTGTPIANRPYDLWSIIYFLDHGKSLGRNFQSFKRSLDLSNILLSDDERRAEYERLLAGLFGRIGEFAIRETKESAGISLPTKTVSNVLVEGEDRQLEIYRAYKKDLRAIVVKRGTPRVDEAEEILKLLLRFVQIASNPKLVDDSYSGTPGKFDVLLPILERHLAAPEDAKAIVWTSFTANADWLTRELREFGAVKVHGKMGIDDRNDAIARFKENPRARVLVATPGAAKEGLTLTVANLAVFFDRSFSLDDYLQAQDRIHRISQSRPCFVYNLIMRNTVDEWVDELLTAKHMSAQLGLGDIGLESYTQNADYRFVETLQRILGQLTVEDSDGR